MLEDITRPTPEEEKEAAQFVRMFRQMTAGAKFTPVRFVTHSFHVEIDDD